MRVLAVALFAILAFAALAATFTWRTPMTQAAFRFTSAGSISTLDPAAMSWIQDLRIAGLLYEGLLSTDPATMQSVPACADRIDVDPSSREYTFHIRTDARWSDAAPLTAHDFVFAWRRAIEPGTAADYQFFIAEIDGVAAYVDWRWSECRRIETLPGDDRPAAVRSHLAEADRRFADSVALRATDEHTLWMRLRRPLPYWRDLVSFAVMYPLPRRAVEAFRRVGDTGLIFYDEQWARPGVTPYNGPYVLTDWQFKRGLRLTRNPHYWDRGRIHIDSVAYVDVADENTAWLMYSSGSLDWLPSIETSFAPALVAAMRDGGRSDIHTVPAFGVYFYNFNCRPTLADGAPNPFADARVRRAFALAVDREALTAHVTRRGETPVTALVPHGVVPGYPRVEGLSFDPQRARRELAAAGYPGGRGFPGVHLLYTTDGDHGLIAETLAQMWRSVLGVEARLVGKEVQSFREDKKSQRFMLARAAWYGDYLDPTTFLDILRTGNGNNDSAYSDPKYDAMLGAADATTDPALRLSRLAEAERYLSVETVPVLPLLRFVHVTAFEARRWPGFDVNPRLVFSLKDIQSPASPE